MKIFLRSQLALLFCILSFAFAGTPQTWQGDIDGVPTWITVVPRGREISPAQLEQSWTTWGNAETDAYLFAFNDAESVHLILEFQTVNSLPEAKFFVKQQGAEPLDYTLTGDTLRIDAKAFYHLKVEGGSWYIDGLTNYNLFSLLDGVDGNELAEPDGKPDFERRVGSDILGEPVWTYNKMINDPHPSWGYPRYGVGLRMEDSPDFEVQEPLLPSFPHFGLGMRPRHWFDINPSPIFFRLDRFELELSSFVGFHIGGMYQSNSIALPPHLNFETPFAFYNFEEESRQAELVIRGSHTPPKDPFRGLLARGVPKTDFRYSWKAFENSRWQYGLHLAGTYPFDEKITIGSEEIFAVEPDELPEWVVDKPWPVVSFVEAVNGFAGSEGIYFYSAQARPVWPWLIGVDNDEPPFFGTPFLQEDTQLGSSPDESIPTGFRGEYNSAYNQVPRLYYGPIDNRVHLYGAQGGIWNLGSGRVLRSHNHFGSPYVNGWTLEEVPVQVAPEREFVANDEGEDHVNDGSLDFEAEEDVFLPKALPGDIEVALYALGDYLLYLADDSELMLRRADFELASFELLPPKDEPSWQKHLDLLEPFQGLEGNPFNIKSWLDNSPGPSLTIEGIRIKEIHTSSKGLNVMLEVMEGASINNDLPELGVDTAATGNYSLRYVAIDDRWQLEPAVTGLLEAELIIDGGVLYIDQPNEFDLVISNPGNIDRSGEASLSIGETEVKTWDNLHVPGGSQVIEELSWIPFFSEGETPLLTWGGAQFELDELDLSIRPRVKTLELARLSFGGGVQALLFFLFSIGAVTALYRQVWR